MAHNARELPCLQVIHMNFYITDAQFLLLCYVVEISSFAAHLDDLHGYRTFNWLGKVTAACTGLADTLLHSVRIVNVLCHGSNILQIAWIL
eukprot:c26313_g1_i1 orf=399-671(-)